VATPPTNDHPAGLGGDQRRHPGASVLLSDRSRRRMRERGARNCNFSLAFAGAARTLIENARRQRADAEEATRPNGRNERMTKRITMAAATAGHAEGGTPLNAFDNALLAAGIGNINLVKISSILPPDVPVIELPKIKPGALIPTAYAAMTSEKPGETVAAAVGYALPDDPAKNGVIMEFHGHASREEAERQIRDMLDEAFRVRGEPIREMKVFAVEHTVERVGCALAAITLLAEEDLV
jgi:arginine decarboxylase